MFFCVAILAVVVLAGFIPGMALAAGSAASAEGNNCPLPGSISASAVETVKVRSVYDGDTLTTNDGRKVRLLGVNTPELGRDGKGDQPLARQAKAAVEAFVGKNTRLTLVYDRQRNDRYGRNLAHIYNSSGQNLEALLLSQGLAWHVVMPPNLALANCLATVEKKARHRQVGLWGTSHAASDARKVSEGGYQRVQGRVESVVFARAWWINLDGKVAAVIYPEHQQRFSRKQLRALEGKRVELRGWVYASRSKGGKPWRVKVETPYALESLSR